MERLTMRITGGKSVCEASEHCDNTCDKCLHLDRMIKKLANYEDAEEQGLLLRLPCKEGSRVYEIVDDCKFGSDCYAKRTCNSCEYRDLHVEPLILATKANIVLRMPDFGKTWFLTEAEAKAALAEYSSEI